MSEEDNVAKLEKAISQGLPPQQSDTDTSNWNDKQSTDPSGEYYIRTGENADKDGE